MDDIIAVIAAIEIAVVVIYARYRAMQLDRRKM